MDDIRGMRRGERPDDLHRVIDRAIDRHRHIVRQTAQRHAIDEFHHNEIAVVDGIDIVDRDDVRVVQGRGGSRFLGEAPLALGTLRAGVQDLDRDLPTQTVVVGFVDDAHAAASDFASDQIARG
jgi:hypothetical protein